MRMAMPNQVQLRGGTSVEHESFTGAPREVTVDTDIWTLRVHNGHDVGGIPLVNYDVLRSAEERLDKRIDDMQNNLGGSHNHDDKYSLNTHNHDAIYLKKVADQSNMFTKRVGDYNGFCYEGGTDTGWLRTTANGFLPYKSGGYSALGSSAWRFNEGWFNNLDSSVCYTKQLQLPGGDVRNQIKFGNNDYISYNDGTNEFDFLADDGVNNSIINSGVHSSSKYALISGTRLYIQSSDPGNVPVGSVWIKI